MSKIFLNPAFIIGLIIRIIFILIIAPKAVSEWYLPFLDETTNYTSMDPWFIWLNSNGITEAYPYGYAMWLIQAPFIFISKIISIPMYYAYCIPILFIDLMLLLVLNKIIGKIKFLIYTYWLSPIIILATYVLGYNDIIPVLFLTSSLYYVRKNKLLFSGFLLALAISAKLSMIIAMPIFMIYIYNNKSLRKFLFSFIKGFSLGFIVFLLPFLFSNSGMLMIFKNQEIQKTYDLAIILNDQISVYIVPLIYLLILYFSWRIKRINFELFYRITCLSFLLLILLTPASPGWFIWTIPFLVLYQAKSDKISLILVTFFSILYLISTMIVKPVNFASGSEYFIFSTLMNDNSLITIPTSLFNTIMLAIGIILTVRILREGIYQNDFFRLSRSPFSIGVSGDSGSGKDTFSNSIEQIFGNHSVVKISGDDYHLWDRKKPMWQVMTHLNPSANDLESFKNDIISLIDGKSIKSRHYNHSTGKMSTLFNVNSNDIIIASGLHSLYIPTLRRIFDLKIYLDMDEELRRHLKIKRDVNQRGHKLDDVIDSLNKRKSDFNKYIKIQKNHADLIFSVQAIKLNDSFEDEIKTRLFAISREDFDATLLNRILVGVMGLHVETSINNENSETSISIEGDITAKDIAISVDLICPEIVEFLDISPEWEPGVRGLMQLITLTHINHQLTKRFLNK